MKVISKRAKMTAIHGSTLVINRAISEDKLEIASAVRTVQDSNKNLIKQTK